MPLYFSFFFFFNDTATTEIYTLSLHDALPISRGETPRRRLVSAKGDENELLRSVALQNANSIRSEEHTSELQSRLHLVCRLLLEKKKKKKKRNEERTTMTEQTDEEHRTLKRKR